MYTTLPFIVLFMVGLATMPALPIYQVNAWNVGTVKFEPWRSKASSIHQAAAQAVGWFARFFQSRAALMCAALLLAVLVTQVTADASGLALAVVPVFGTVVELREKREKLIRDAGELMGPNNTFKTADDRTKFDAIMKDVDELRVQIEDTDRADKLAGMTRSTLPESQRTDADERIERDNPELAKSRKEYRGAILDYVRNGMSMMATESQKILMQRGFHKFSDEEKRVMSSVGGAAGGFTVLPDMSFAACIIESMKFYGGVMEAGAEVINTETGADLPFPTNDDTANVGEIVGESGSHSSGTDLAFGLKILKSYLYSTKIVLVPWQLLQDSSIDIEAYLAGKFGIRLGRVMNTHATVGTGANQPEGVMTNMTVGRQAATGNSTTFPVDDVFRVVHSVDRAYRTAKSKWMMNDSTILGLRLAKDGNGRYLWPELSNIQAGEQATLAGYGVVPNNDVAAMAASVKAASFGDHSYYKWRNVRGFTLVRLDQLYAASGQVGFMAFARADGGYVDPGQPAVKAFQNSAA